MNLDYPFEAIGYHILSRGIISFNHQDEILMVNKLVCMVTHWTKPNVSHDIRLLGSHDFTKLLHYIVS